MQRRTFLQLAGAWGLLARYGNVSGAEAAPLRMAVHPYNSPLALMSAHRPLFQYLAKALGREIEFYTAPSFEAYVKALLAGEYDIPISPPHFALLGMEKGHYVPLAHYQTRLEPLLVVKRDSPLQRPADFIGKRIAMADKSALIRIVVVKWLADAGLVAGRDYQVVERPTHSASVSAVIVDEADAGLATTTAFRQVPPDVFSQLRAVSTGHRFPHLFTLANKRLGSPLINQLKRSLLDFSSDHPDGRVFFEKTAYGGFEPVSTEEITALQPYLDATRKIVDAMH